MIIKQLSSLPQWRKYVTGQILSTTDCTVVPLFYNPLF